MLKITQLKTAYIVLVVILVLNAFSWNKLRYVQQEWLNVPNSPTKEDLAVSYLSDLEFAYRSSALKIQNFGDTGGRTGRFQDYHYDNLMGWLFLMDELNDKSSHIPFLGAYYFSATDKKDQLRLLTNYLNYVGHRPYDEHWRWLVQAIFIAKHNLKDYSLAKQYAENLARLYRPNDMPAYTIQMPAFIENDLGDKEAAYTILMSILKSSASDLHPNEVFFMKDYICNRILTEEEKSEHPLCQ